MSKIYNAELKISKICNEIVSKNKFVYFFFKFITTFAEWWMYLIYAFALIIFYDFNTALKLIKIGSIAFSFHYPIYFIIKNYTKRIRPCDTNNDIESFIKPPDKYSMPSGHSSGSNIVTLIFVYYFSISHFFYLIPILIASSRVFLGVHYISDTIIGLALGYFCFNISILIVA
tara:strand:- start:360 stop:878 length:519 start_codon:yes stop_codon:yes gene_type:complete